MVLWILIELEMQVVGRVLQGIFWFGREWAIVVLSSIEVEIRIHGNQFC